VFGIDKNIIFFLKAVMFGVAALILIPKEQYKKYLIYGLFLGAGLDIITIIILTYLGAIKYLNMGVFSIYGMFTFWTPIAWMFTLMIYLYFLPIRRWFLYGYVFTFSVFGIFIGKILSNFGLYEFNPFILFFVLLGWFSFAAWFYLRFEKIKLE